MKPFIILCLLLCFYKTDAIVNGTDAELNDVPYAVVVYIKGRLLCAGSLIAKNKVLTAADCAEYDYKITVRVGLKNHSIPDYPEYLCSNKSIHPEYKALKDVNLAVLTLERDVNLEEYTNASFATLQTEELPINSKAHVFGWGWQEFQNKSSVPDNLKKATTFVRSSDQPHYIAARSPHSSACFVDVGRPLESSDGKLAGVYSHNKNWFCSIGSVNYFTKVSEYISWIKAQ